MNKELNRNQIDYILFHLSFFIDLNELKNYFIFSVDEKRKPENKQVFFYLSSEGIDENKIIYIENIPVLFPNSEIIKPYELKNGCLIFNHDLIKSAFYLLSGIQEYFSDETDWLGRFPYKNSIQERLGIIEIPVVNYYFSWIIAGLKDFCVFHNIEFIERKPFQEGIFILSHDIDRIAKYDYYGTAYKILELFGLKPSISGRLQNLKLIPKYIFSFLFLPRKFDPYWNFVKLREVETTLGIRSTWYFLEKQDKHDNSRYTFTEKKIQKLMEFLVSEKCEIGLHGTVRSAFDLNAMSSTLNNLKENTTYPITGNRQHKLIFKNPNTFKVQQEAGLRYDHTLTFAEHEGFRNSYCFPYRPYDFEKDEMMNIWEIPLIVMDGTLFYYRKLSFKEIEQQIDLLVTEVKKFGGIFSLLWHNSHFNEDEFPGIGMFYKKILQQITNTGIIPMTAAETSAHFKI